MPVVWDERCRLHDPAGEVFVGVRTRGTEVTGRLDAIAADIQRSSERPDTVTFTVTCETLGWVGK